MINKNEFPARIVSQGCDSTRCALCQKERELRKSHIVPEFLYRPIYDDKHRTQLFRHGDTRSQLLQKGVREHLLCDCCEGHLQKFEDYFARYWYQDRPLPDPIPTQWVSLSNIDFGMLKLFLLSIIWRASVAKSPTFESVDLGPHEEPIRMMLLSSNPGPVDYYQIYAGLIIDMDSRKLWDKVIQTPTKIKVDGLWAYRIVFSGVAWTILVSRHKDLPFKDNLLTKSGDLKLLCIDWKEFARETGLPEATRKINF